MCLICQVPKMLRIILWTWLLLSSSRISLLFAQSGMLEANSTTLLRIYPSGLIVPRVEDIVTVTCRVQPSSSTVGHTSRHPASSSLDRQNEFLVPLYNLEWNLPSSTTNNQPSRRSHINITRHRNKLTLNIMGIQKRDSGVYLCTATSPEQETLVSNVTIAVVPKKGTCNKGFFVCGTKEYYCIANRFVCDGRPDCPDGSDEATTKCGVDPCGDKILCDDGRCLDRKLCCDSAYDELCQIERLPLCCLQHLKTKLLEQHAAHYDDMGFLQSTVYAVIGCVATFVFVVAITVVAICRLHMKQTAMTAMSRLGENINRRSTCNDLRRPPLPSQPIWTNIYRNEQQQRRDDNSSYILEVQRLPPPPPVDLLIACRRPNVVFDDVRRDTNRLVGRVVEPPPYSETVQNPPSSDAPPPPYSVSFANHNAPPPNSNRAPEVADALNFN